jgi:hypothetical protein
MNYLKKQQENRNLKSLFRNPYPEGCLKWSRTSRLHYNVMADIFYWFKDNGYECWSEVVFKTGGRADIVAIKDQFAYAIEILVSETSKRFSKKLDVYPLEFEMIKVEGKNFKYEDFKI